MANPSYLDVDGFVRNTLTMVYIVSSAINSAGWGNWWDGMHAIYVDYVCSLFQQFIVYCIPFIENVLGFPDVVLC